jgi:ketosteroid isomerase-like protein
MTAKGLRTAMLAACAAAALAAAFGLGGAVAATSRPTLEQRLQKVEDRFELEELLFAYDKALDARDWHAYAAVFAEDAVLGTGPNARRGRKAIEDSLIATMTRAFSRPDAPGFLQHNYNSLHFEINGDTAIGFHHWQVVGTTANKVPIVTEAGHYEDTYKRVNGRWWIASRNIVGDIARAPAGAVAVAGGTAATTPAAARP